MLKRAMAAALGWLALAGMQAPPARAPLSLWRLDCGDFQINDINAFMSDTSEYPARPKHLVGSCYLIRHGDAYLLWDTGIPAGIVGHPLETPALRATLRASIALEIGPQCFFYFWRPKLSRQASRNGSNNLPRRRLKSPKLNQ